MMTSKINEANTDIKEDFFRGLHNGIPICLGYVSVGFTFGMMCTENGLSFLVAVLISLTNLTSAGQFAGTALIISGGSLLEIGITTFVINLRYMLMSLSISQKVDVALSIPKRMLMSFGITDEIFGISIAQPGYLNPWYVYGALLVAVPGWSIGTALGTIAGNLLPLRLVSAFSVALYGMFLATIIPPAKKDRVIAVLIILCFAASFGAAYLPVVSELSEGTRTILLTVIISAGAALLFPRKTVNEEVQSS